MKSSGPGLPADTGRPGEKGLKHGALGFLSGVVIGVASTAPGYSLAAALGLVAAQVGFQAPAVMILAFVPMLLIAISYYYLNRADPDCGTTFSWVTKAMGPSMGWLAGWAIIVSGIIVMANLAQIASLYTYRLVGVAVTDRFGILAIGCAWILLVTWICYIGIETSARAQWLLLSAEVAALVVFAVVALVKVRVMAVPGEVAPSLDWVNPFAIDSWSGLAAGIMLAVFLYWGWDATVAVNEESENPARGPGVAAVVSTLILVGIYVLVSVAAIAYHGPDFLAADENAGDVLGALGTDVLGRGWDRLLVVAVLTSATASAQTGILATTRTALSMAAKRAAPGWLARIDPRFQTPGAATLAVGAVSVLWYVGLTIASRNILYDALLALGLMIAFYYGLTGFACAIYFRHELLRSARNLVMIGVAPVLGGLIFTWALVKSVIDLADPASSTTGDAWFGLGPPLVIGIGFALLGVLLMILQRMAAPGFFRRAPEVLGAMALSEAAHARNPARRGGV